MSVAGLNLVQRWFPGTGSSYDRVVRLTTLGLDARWKRRLLDRLPPSRAVLDLACGTGILTFEVLARNPDARVVGVDVTPDYLAVARAKHRVRGGDVTFLHGDAQTVDLAPHGPFDAVVSSYLPKYVDADRLVANLTPALAPGAHVLLHDFALPPRRLPRALWHAYFAVLDPLASRAFPAWGSVFDRGLHDLIVRSPWVHDLCAAFTRRGYERVHALRLTFGAAALVVARAPGGARAPPRAS